MFTLRMHDPLSIAEQWYGEGRAIALATVIETWGSAPRPVGSHLLVDGEGNFEGSVSGGCVEGAVITEALDVIAVGEAKILEFGIADETAWRVGLSCGGRIRIYVERLGLKHVSRLERLNVARRARKPAVLVTDIEGDDAYLIVDDEQSNNVLTEDAVKALQSGRSGRIDADGRRYFMNVYLPPVQIVIIGAVHISQVLSQMAVLAGFDVRVIDPRTAFATHDRFNGFDLVPDWPADALKGRPLDGYTALVAVTHDPKIDDFPVAEALRVGCFYVGALGSRKTHALRLERLKVEGFGEVECARIRAPIGLGIGASNPAEIAVAILAEIIQTFRGRGVAPWRDDRI